MAWLAFLLVTTLWGLIGGLAPFFIPSGPQKFLYQVMLIMAAVCCWLQWFLCFLSQLNPLQGPSIDKTNLKIIGWSWEDKGPNWGN
jgi:V-type H+-transporting ATPase subunit e